MSLELKLLDLVELAPLADVVARLGFAPHDRGGTLVADDCPFGDRCPSPWMPDTDYPSLWIYGEGWRTSCCTAMGGPRELAAAALGLWTTPDEECTAALRRLHQPDGAQVAARLRKFAAQALRNDNDPIRALAGIRTWASRYARQLDRHDVDQIIDSVAHHLADAGRVH